MVGGVFVVPPLVASNDLGRVDGRWAEVWHGRRNDDDGTSTADGFGATFLPIFAQDHTLVHHGFTLGTAWRRCGDGLYPLRCSSCRASLWNASLIHCTELSSWEIRWLDCWGQQPIAGLLALDQCRRDFFLRIPFTRNIFHCLIDWLIDRCELIDLKEVIKACFAVCQDRKSSSKCCKHTRWWFSSCGYLAAFHWVEMTVPRCEFVGCGACSQGIRQAELCCTLVQMAHGEGRKISGKLQIQPQVVGILLGPWIWKRKIKLIWLLLESIEVVVSMFCFLVWLILGNAEVMWRHYSLPSCWVK